VRLTLEHVARAVLPAPAPGRALAESERATLARIAEVILEGSPVEIPLSRVVDNFDRFLVAGRSRRAWRCRLLLTLVEYAPVLALGGTLGMLSRDERRRFVLDKLARGGRLWSLCAKVRYFAYVGAYGDPAGVRATGFVAMADRARIVKPRRVMEEAG